MPQIGKQKTERSQHVAGGSLTIEENRQLVTDEPVVFEEKTG